MEGVIEAPQVVQHKGRLAAEQDAKEHDRQHEGQLAMIRDGQREDLAEGPVAAAQGIPGGDAEVAGIGSKPMLAGAPVELEQGDRRPLRLATDDCALHCLPGRVQHERASVWLRHNHTAELLAVLRVEDDAIADANLHEDGCGGGLVALGRQRNPAAFTSSGHNNTFPSERKLRGGAKAPDGIRRSGDKELLARTMTFTALHPLSLDEFGARVGLEVA
mmetsp:Transcript_63319/g.182137  ORF Transcript_63319/g.182137 Transcript_63319/m.182137 type:complete len:218 (+) Transcript_63319:1228-1881(+)